MGGDKFGALVTWRQRLQRHAASSVQETGPRCERATTHLPATFIHTYLATASVASAFCPLLVLHFGHRLRSFLPLSRSRTGVAKLRRAALPRPAQKKADWTRDAICKSALRHGRLHCTLRPRCSGVLYQARWTQARAGLQTFKWLVFAH
jgi:hypothetical protein